MTARSSVIVAVLWSLSLVAVAHWSAGAQGTRTPGVEVRFIQATGAPGAPHGSLIANINGQWLPVTLDTAPKPDGNSMVPGLPRQ
jgi:hypothetical protein